MADEDHGLLFRKKGIMLSLKESLVCSTTSFFVCVFSFLSILVQSKINSCIVLNYKNHPTWASYHRVSDNKVCPALKNSLKTKHLELSKFPKIHLYKNCISEEQRKKLLSLAAKRLTSETNSGFSSSLYLRQKNDAKVEILRDMAKLAGKLSGLPWKNAEPVSLTKYTLKQNYGLHYDSGFFMNGKRTIRKATFLLYLNNVKEGGETVFPFATNQTENTTQKQLERKPIQDICRDEQGVKLAPVSGSCIVFYNHLDNTLDVDPLSLHGSCPVLVGEKWIAQIWVQGKIENEMDIFWKD